MVYNVNATDRKLVTLLSRYPTTIGIVSFLHIVCCRFPSVCVCVFMCLQSSIIIFED